MHHAVGPHRYVTRDHRARTPATHEKPVNVRSSVDSGLSPRRSFVFLTRWRALIYLVLLLLAVALIQFTQGRIFGPETSGTTSLQPR